ncbi:MAG: type I glyceraldehyde-3-phosphate dehydrogenase [Anaerolineae bacterium]|nr:type I glyceraldehyde-3-phosphate dehydrogenase [Anaerolineae bacterium]
MARIGINGFGRIGRQVTKAIKQTYKDIDIVAVNDLASPEENAHLFKYDTNYGKYPGTVEVDGDNIVIDGDKIKVLKEKDPAKLPWKDLGVELVIESTGLFTDADKARAHITAGAKRVLISAPAKGEDITVVLGVNEDKYDPAKHFIVSNASCTTNGLAPVAKILEDNFGIEKALMTTVHAYTNDQKILDVVHKDWRRARAAAMNIIPTTTGAAKAVALTMPELKGKFHGFSLRVPVSTVSIIDLVGNLKRDATAEELNAAFKAASEGSMKGILGYSQEPLVSSDYKGDPRSTIVDAELTMVIGGNLFKVVTWYDNEWGYSSRVADLTKMMADKGL